MPNHTPHPVATHCVAPRSRDLAIAALGAAPLGATPSVVPGFQTTGTVARVKPSQRPAIEAAFPRESYRPGAAARLVIFSKHVRGVRMQIFRAGTEPFRLKRRDEMQGTAVTPVRRLGALHRNQIVRLRVPDSPSGLYFVELTAPRTRRVSRRSSFAHASRRSPRRGRHADVHLAGLQLPRRRRRRQGRHLVRNWRTHVARLGRPFENRGVPPLLRVLRSAVPPLAHQKEKRVDYLGADDVARARPRAGRAYDLIIFPGHHEYVTSASTTRSRASGIAAATSCSCPRTTSSGRS